MTIQNCVRGATLIMTFKTIYYYFTGEETEPQKA